MKVTEKELREMVDKILDKKLNENRDFTAKRQIVQAAQNASMSFENEMNNLLNLVSPDEMNPIHQKAYFDIVEELKLDIVRSVSRAVELLAKLPRNDGGEK